MGVLLYDNLILTSLTAAQWSWSLKSIVLKGPTELHIGVFQEDARNKKKVLAGEGRPAPSQLPFKIPKYNLAEIMMPLMEVHWESRWSTNSIPALLDRL